MVEVVGEGSYTYDGITHAEVIALKQAGERAEAARLMFRLNRTHITDKRRRAPKHLIDAGITRVVARSRIRIRSSQDVVSSVCGMRVSRSSPEFLPTRRRG